jgi:transposase InsO family protein
MPWKGSIVEQRVEFVTLASQEGTQMAELCRRFGISRPAGYKWLRRFRAEGGAGLSDRTRRPAHSPHRSSAEVEAAALAVRDAHPAWGARKIHARLSHEGWRDLPAPSTIHAILRRHDRIDPAESAKRIAFTRFEHPSPNDLWQMDFKGSVAMRCGHCYPLTVLDDHSRYVVGLRACANQRGETVREQLTELFRRYGLPRRILTDNGSPWGGAGATDALTPLTVWLLRLDIAVSHGRPYHPQTQGKTERFHRTLKAELLGRVSLDDLCDGQRRMDLWRHEYNHERPHEAIDLKPPAVRYRVSQRAFPEQLPEPEYGPECELRRVQHGGRVSYRGQAFRVGKALYRQTVGVRPTPIDGVIDVCLGVHPIVRVDLRGAEPAVLRPRTPLAALAPSAAGEPD